MTQRIDTTVERAKLDALTGHTPFDPQCVDCLSVEVSDDGTCKVCGSRNTVTDDFAEPDLLTDYRAVLDEIDRSELAPLASTERAKLDRASVEALAWRVHESKAGREVRADACATLRAQADEIDRLTAALAEAKAREQRLDRLALRAFTVVEWVVGEGLLLSTPHEDADDLLLDMVDFLAVEDSASAQASLAAMDTPKGGGGE